MKINQYQFRSYLVFLDLPRYKDVGESSVDITIDKYK